MTPDAIDGARGWFLELQDRLCAALENEDSGSRFHRDAWQRPEGGGLRRAADGVVVRGGFDPTPYYGYREREFQLYRR